MPQSPNSFDIPWQKLFSETLGTGKRDFRPESGDTEQVPVAGSSSLAVYWHKPVLLGEDKYPDSSIVYLKIIASTQPAAFMNTSVSADKNDVYTEFGSDLPAEWIETVIDGVLPISRMVLEAVVWLKKNEPPIATEIPDKDNNLKDPQPYFMSAAPLRRSIVETGIMGQQIIEGSSNSVAVGKSATSMTDKFDPRTTTTDSDSWGLSISSGLLGGALGGTNTSVTTEGGTRNTVQTADVTQRDAATEREELLNYVVPMRNILSTLTSAHVGSRFLRFVLAPPPVRDIPAGVTESDAAYLHLLRQRAKGVEGIQEFFAVLSVPRGQTFCLAVTMNRMFRFDALLPQSRWPDTFVDNDPSTPVDLEVDYLNKKYPSGTSIDDDIDREFLDRDLPRDDTGAEIPREAILSPVVGQWQQGFFENGKPKNLEGIYCSYHYGFKKPSADVELRTGRAFYKMVSEVRKEALTLKAMDDQLEWFTERTQLVGFLRPLQVGQCGLDAWPDIQVQPKSHKITDGQLLNWAEPKVTIVSWPVGLGTPKGELLRNNVGSNRGDEFLRRARAISDIHETSIDAFLAMGGHKKDADGNRLQQHAIDLALLVLANLDPKDPRNLEVNHVKRIFQVDDATIERLKNLRITDLRTFARWVRSGNKPKGDDLAHDTFSAAPPRGSAKSKRTSSVPSEREVTPYTLRRRLVLHSTR